MRDQTSAYTWEAKDIELSQCVTCIHKRSASNCDAFPRGIPWLILTNVRDHRKPFDGDNSIRFEPLPGERSPFEEAE